MRRLFAQVGQRRHWDELPRLRAAVGMVHGGTAPVHEVAAEVAAHHHAGTGGGARPHADAASAAATQPAQQQVEAQRRHVDRPVHQPDPAVPAVQVLPIGEPGGNGRGGAGGPCLHRQVGRARGAAVAQQPSGGQEVEAQRQRPGPDRDGHDERVDRMP